MREFLENHRGELVELSRVGEREPIRGTVEAVGEDAVILKTADGITALRLDGIEMVNVPESSMPPQMRTPVPEQNMRPSMPDSAVPRPPQAPQPPQESSLVVPSLNTPGPAPIVRNR